MRKCECVHAQVSMHYSDVVWFEQYGPTPANRFLILSPTLDIQTARVLKCVGTIFTRVSVYTQ